MELGDNQFGHYFELSRLRVCVIRLDLQQHLSGGTAASHALLSGEDTNNESFYLVRFYRNATNHS